MLTQVVQFKNVPEQYKNLFRNELDSEQIVYLIKDCDGRVKSITTSINSAIQKTQGIIQSK